MFTRKTWIAVGSGILVLAIALGIVFDMPSSMSAPVSPSVSEEKQQEVETILRGVARQAYQEGTAHITMSMPIAGEEMTIEGVIRFGQRDPALSVEVKFQHDITEIRVVDDELYVNPPDRGFGLSIRSDEESWIEAQPGGPISEKYGTVVEQVRKNLGPKQFVQRLIQAGMVIESAERVNLDGVRSQYYRFSYDYSKLPDKYLEDYLTNVPRGYRDEVRQVLTETVTQAQLWIDPDELLPRKFTLDLGPIYENVAEVLGEPSVADRLGDGAIKFTYELWGTPVNIEAPDEDELR